MPLQPHPLLRAAIEDKRMIQLVYHGMGRLLEPHDHGILNGSVQLLGNPVAGFSGRPIPNWILMKVDEIVDLNCWSELAGGRPADSGKHLKWDVLFIRVKPASDYLRAGSE